MAEWLTGLGLLVNMIGVLILFRFAHPASSAPVPGNLIWPIADDPAVPESERHRRWAKAGLGLVLAGVGFQLAALVVA